MDRISSKGNPYHDRKGRFARKDSMDIETQDDQGQLVVKKSKVDEDRKAVKWSSFDEVHDISSMTDKQAHELDKDRTDENMHNGKRFYHKQSIKREQYSKEIANITIDENLTEEETITAIDNSFAEFMKENKVAISWGGSVVTYVNGNNIRYQVVQNDRIIHKVSKKNSEYILNTSTGMKQFSGYTVDIPDDKYEKVCKKTLNLEEAKKRVFNYCNKNKHLMSQPNVCIKTWRDGDGNIHYKPVYHFDNEEDAKKFSANFEGASITNQDDNYQG